MGQSGDEGYPYIVHLISHCGLGQQVGKYAKGLGYICDSLRARKSRLLIGSKFRYRSLAFFLSRAMIRMAGSLLNRASIR